MQIAIEEQHGANPRYTYGDVTCQGATTGDFDFQMDYLPKALTRQSRVNCARTASPLALWSRYRWKGLKASCRWTRGASCR